MEAVLLTREMDFSLSDKAAGEKKEEKGGQARVCGKGGPSSCPTPILCINRAVEQLVGCRRTGGLRENTDISETC